MAKPTTKATKKYSDRMYERITITVKKGEKERLDQFAIEQGYKDNPTGFYRKLIYDAAGWKEPSADEIRERLKIKIPDDAVKLPSYFIDRNNNLYCYKDSDQKIYAKDKTGNILYLNSKDMHEGYIINSLGEKIRNLNN
jgi:hypothetical protein